MLSEVVSSLSLDPDNPLTRDVLDTTVMRLEQLLAQEAAPSPPQEASPALEGEGLPAISGHWNDQAEAMASEVQRSDLVGRDPNEYFDMIDANHDGVIDQAEWQSLVERDEGFQELLAHAEAEQAAQQQLQQNQSLASIGASLDQTLQLLESSRRNFQVALQAGEAYKQSEDSAPQARRLTSRSRTRSPARGGSPPPVSLLPEHSEARKGEPPKGWRRVGGGFKKIDEGSQPPEAEPEESAAGRERPEPEEAPPSLRSKKSLHEPQVLHRLRVSTQEMVLLTEQGVVQPQGEPTASGQHNVMLTSEQAADLLAWRQQQALPTASSTTVLSQTATKDARSRGDGNQAPADAKKPRAFSTYKHLASRGKHCSTLQWEAGLRDFTLTPGEKKWRS